jgi:hypothetical protein
MTLLAEGIGALTFHKLIQVGEKRASGGFAPWFPYQGSAGLVKYSLYLEHQRYKTSILKISK